jgi:hypothetical protein
MIFLAVDGVIEERARDRAVDYPVYDPWGCVLIACTVLTVAAFLGFNASIRWRRGR